MESSVHSIDEAVTEAVQELVWLAKYGNPGDELKFEAARSLIDTFGHKDPNRFSFDWAESDEDETDE